VKGKSTRARSLSIGAGGKGGIESTNRQRGSRLGQETINSMSYSISNPLIPVGPESLLRRRLPPSDGGLFIAQRMFAHKAGT
jgi:hypothetical protein